MIASVRPPLRRRGFSLVELLTVVAITSLLMVMAMQGVSSANRGKSLTDTAYQIQDLLNQSRAYAIANNTYVWIGFSEEDGSRPSTVPATLGTGRIVVSMVASKQGTLLEDDARGGQYIRTDQLTQINKLYRFSNSHLTSFSAGNGGGETFDTRPAVDPSGMLTQLSPTRSFQFPVGGSNGAPPTAAYVFTQILQFDPLGECRLGPTGGGYSVDLRHLVEIGLLPAQGQVAAAGDKSTAAIQMTGIGGIPKIYLK